MEYEKIKPVKVKKNVHRIGKFEISWRMLDKNHVMIAEIFSRLKMLPVRAEHLFHCDAVEYIALCDKFDEINMHDIPPEYTLNISVNEDGSLKDVEVVRI